MDTTALWLCQRMERLCMHHKRKRFTNLKGDYGFPKNAIKDCLKSTNTKVKDIIKLHWLQSLPTLF